MTPKKTLSVFLVGLALSTIPAVTEAKDTQLIKVAIGQKGLWDAMVMVNCIEEGICKKHGLDVDIVWTRGGSETLQAAITGSVDFALTNGTMGVLGAYAKGAPIRIVSSDQTGISDLFWYVKSDSPIKSMKDADGKTMSYTRPGASTHLAALAIAKAYGARPKFVPTGGVPDTLTQTLSGQIDLGFSVPPFGLDRVESGEIRIIVRGGDLPELQNQTARVNVVNKSFLDKNPDATKAFLAAYEETFNWMYDNLDAPVARYARANNVSVGVARAAVEFYPRQALDPNRLVGLRETMMQAIELGELAAPLTDSQLSELLKTKIE